VRLLIDRLLIVQTGVPGSPDRTDTHRWLGTKSPDECGVCDDVDCSAEGSCDMPMITIIPASASARRCTSCSVCYLTSSPATAPRFCSIIRRLRTGWNGYGLCCGDCAKFAVCSAFVGCGVGAALLVPHSQTDRLLGDSVITLSRFTRVSSSTCRRRHAVLPFSDKTNLTAAEAACRQAEVAAIGYTSTAVSIQLVVLLVSVSVSLRFVR
jgi:hypothetical protein